MTGQEFSQAVATKRVTNLREMIEALQDLEIAALTEGTDGSCVYVNTAELPSVGLTLVERTLTDGSIVYDVEVG